MTECTFAVIGAGFMGRNLARVGAALPYARCVGVADLDEGRAKELAAQCGAPAYRDYEAMLARERPDAVIVATPETHHREPAVAAAQAGCHLLVEKPLAATLEDADAILEACNQAGVKLMTGYILRFEPAYALIQTAVAEGSVGRFLSAYARRNAGIREARRLGGRCSILTYLAVHDVDQILWYHPAPVARVYARGLRGRVWEELGVHDYTWTLVEFGDGALAVVESGWGLPEEWAAWQRPQGWGGFGDVQMNVIGTEGVLNLNFTPMDLRGCDREGWKFPDTRHWPQVHGKLAGAVKLEVEHFFTCVLEDREPLVTGVDGRRSLEVIVAAQRSIDEGAPVALPL
ncbi:MAG: Gfo/Idh/MocA family oxidoreductase [Anaerolineae bacterium]|nr:Gfo/Idh/MocA family oxidoreductase [Anaerolineae bacterium]